MTCKSATRIVLATLGIATSCLLAFSQSASAHEEWEHQSHGKVFSAQDRLAFAKKHIDKEASMLEITASQQSAWAAYAAAKLDLIGSFGAMRKPVEMADLDAAAAARKHADFANDIAQKLAKVADATEKLQAVLSEDQRKVLNRIAAHHGFREHFGHRGEPACDMRHEHMPEHGHQAKGAAKPHANPTADMPAAKAK